MIEYCCLDFTWSKWGKYECARPSIERIWYSAVCMPENHPKLPLFDEAICKRNIINHCLLSKSTLNLWSCRSSQAVRIEPERARVILCCVAALLPSLPLSSQDSIVRKEYCANSYVSISSTPGKLHEWWNFVNYSGFANLCLHCAFPDALSLLLPSKERLC